MDQWFYVTLNLVIHHKENVAFTSGKPFTDANSSKKAQDSQKATVHTFPQIAI